MDLGIILLKDYNLAKTIKNTFDKNRKDFIMYKLIALDMDGTLLNNNKTISKENKRAIKFAKDLGIKIVLCTGRPIEGIHDYLKELSLISSDDYCITCSGAMIQNTLSKEIIQKQSLSLHEARYLYDLSKSLGIDITFYTNNQNNNKSNNKFIAFNSNLYSKLEAEGNNVNYEKISIDSLDKEELIIKCTFINEQEDSFKQYKNFFYKDTSIYNSMTFENKNTLELFSSKENMPKELYEKFSVLKSSDFTLEVINKNANKGNAVKCLCKHLNIPQSQVICMGDSGNDEHMIRYAGLGVAMGNAFEQIKLIADYVTKTNEEDGVAYVINNLHNFHGGQVL